MLEQRAIPSDRPRPKRGLDVDEPAVKVLVDGELVRVERDTVAAALQLFLESRLGLLARGVTAQVGEPALAVRAAWQLDPWIPAEAPARALALVLGMPLDALAVHVAAATHRRSPSMGCPWRAGPAGPAWGCGWTGRYGWRGVRGARLLRRAGCARSAGPLRPRGP